MVKVTVNVEGMMCGHCEAHVNEAIKKAFGVEDVVSSHENNTTGLDLGLGLLQLCVRHFQLSVIFWVLFGIPRK